MPLNFILFIIGDAFSAMVVYGFLNYENGCVSVPNKELMDKFAEVAQKEASLLTRHSSVFPVETAISGIEIVYLTVDKPVDCRHSCTGEGAGICSHINGTEDTGFRYTSFMMEASSASLL